MSMSSGALRYRSYRRFLGVLILLLGTVACDQATKQLATESFSEAVPYALAGGAVELLYSENHGAFLGLGAELEPPTRFWLFTVGVTVLLLIFLVKLFLARGVAELIGWSLVVGGGLGNLIDRVRYDGRVVDFVRVGFGEWRTGIFNVADTVIVVGLLLLFVAATRRPFPEKSAGAFGIESSSS